MNKGGVKRASRARGRAVCLEALEGRCYLTAVSSPVHPPNAQISAGPTEVLETDGGNLLIFDEATSASLGSLPFTTLFPDYLGSKPHDPRIIYDAANGHFILAFDDRTAPQTKYPNGLSYLELAVSKTDDPTANLSSWYTYRVNVGTPVINGQLTSWDQESLGMDSQAIYVTANQLSWTNQQEGSELITLNLAQLESGTAPQNPLFVTPANTMEFSNAYSIQPAFNEDTGAPVEYMVEAIGLTSGPTANQLKLYAVSNPLSTMTVSTKLVTIPTYDTYVPNAPQPGTDVVIGTNNGQLANAVWSNGSLYTTQAVGVQNAVYDKSVVRFYQITTQGWTGSTSGPQPILSHYGGINPQASIYTYYPDIAADALGDVVISFTASSTTLPVSAYYITRTPSIVYSSFQLIQAGYAPYSYTPWGDYNGAAYDPGNPGTFYVSGEYPSGATTIGVAWTSVTMASSAFAASTMPPVSQPDGSSLLIADAVTSDFWDDQDQSNQSLGLSHRRRLPR
jgi:hypothetical protein